MITTGKHSCSGLHSHAGQGMTYYANYILKDCILVLYSSENFFFPDGTSVRERAQLREAGASQDAASGDEGRTDDDPFAVTAGRFVYGSGAFFALKIQSAQSVAQLEEFAKEIQSLEKLRGHPNIVQIRDHTIIHESRHVVILMELAACDLQTYFRRRDYRFNVQEMCFLWRSLTRAVDVAHQEEVIHRDLKPQNFLLVPIAPPFADRILATTKIPPEKFDLRIAPEENEADMKLVTGAQCCGCLASFSKT